MRFGNPPPPGPGPIPPDIEMGGGPGMLPGMIHRRGNSAMAPRMGAKISRRGSVPQVRGWRGHVASRGHVTHLHWGAGERGDGHIFGGGVGGGVG